MSVQHIFVAYNYKVQDICMCLSVHALVCIYGGVLPQPVTSQLYVNIFSSHFLRISSKRFFFFVFKDAASFAAVSAKIHLHVNIQIFINDLLYMYAYIYICMYLCMYIFALLLCMIWTSSGNWQVFDTNPYT